MKLSNYYEYRKDGRALKYRSVHVSTLNVYNMPQVNGKEANCNAPALWSALSLRIQSEVRRVTSDAIITSPNCLMYSSVWPNDNCARGASNCCQRAINCFTRNANIYPTHRMEVTEFQTQHLFQTKVHKLLAGKYNNNASEIIFGFVVCSCYQNYRRFSCSPWKEGPTIQRITPHPLAVRFIHLGHSKRR
jgi:hypothetical protein